MYHSTACHHINAGILFNTRVAEAVARIIVYAYLMAWVLFLIPVMCWGVAMGEIKLLNDVRGVVVGGRWWEGCLYVVCSQIATKTSVWAIHTEVCLLGGRSLVDYLRISAPVFCSS